MYQANYKVLKEYYYIWRLLLNKYKYALTKEEYYISYNYNKDNNVLSYIINDYYSDDSNKIKKTVKIKEEDFNSLVELLIANGFKISHHYISIENKIIKRNKGEKK